MKKMIAVILMLSTIFIVGPSVLAETLSNGSRPETGNLTIHKHYLPEGVAAGDPGNGSSEAVQLPDKAVPLSGVHFDLYRVGELLRVSTDQGKTWRTEAESIVIPGGDAVYYRVEVTGSQSGWTVIAQTAKKFYQYRLLSVSGYEKGGQSGREPAGEVTFSDLAAGEYIVVENLAKSDPHKVGDNQPVSLEFAVDPFAVSVPIQIDDKWSRDVHVYPKNKSNELVKEYDTNTPSIGAVIDYQISTAIPENIASYQRFEIWDELHSGHTLVEPTETINLYQAHLVTQADQTKKIVIATDSQGKAQAIPKKQMEELWQVSVEGQKFTITFTSAGRNYLAKHKIERLAVSFKARVNESAHTSVLDSEGNVIPNQAWIVFTDQQGQMSERPTNETQLPLVEVNVIKQNEEHQPLRATFAITTSKENAEKNRFIRVKYGHTNGKKDLSKVLAVKTPEQTGYAQTAADPSYEDYQLTTDAKTGKAKFLGLPVTDKNYWIKETAAPAGYQPLREPQKVNRNASPSSWTKADLAAYNQQQITVINVRDKATPKDPDEPNDPAGPGGFTGGVDLVQLQAGAPSVNRPSSWWSYVMIVVPKTAEEAISETKRALHELPKTGSTPATLLVVIGIFLLAVIIILGLNRHAKRKSK